MMGVCFDCLVTIDGVGNRQACLVRVREGMRVETAARQARSSARERESRCSSATTSSSSARDRRASRPRRRARRPGLATVLCSTSSPRAGRPDLSRRSPTRRCSDARVLGADYWRGAAARRRASTRAARSIVAGRDRVERLARARDRRLARRRLAAAQRAARDPRTGALERPFPIPGWTLPGVMTAGAAQILLKSSRPRAGGPHGARGLRAAALAARVAVPATRACTIDAILDTTTRANWRARAAAPAGVPALAAISRKGLKLMRAVQREGRA